MSTQQKSLKALVSGVHNLLPDEIIPRDAASDALGWLHKDGHAELQYGRQAIGGVGSLGKSYGEWTAYRADGTAVRFRKVQGTIQYLNGSSWVNVITGLTATADYTASNYVSLAGAFVYFFGVDGIFKICTANPTDYATLYDSTKNFKGYGFIDKARSILWGRAEDPTGLYGSYIDAQNSTVYTTVSGEAIGSSGSQSYSGTLAFKAGDAKRTCFGVSIVATVGAGTETFTDNFNGVLTSNFGGTGTINYMTGAYSVTFSAITTGSVTGSYQWENSNNKGVTDFTKSGTRLAGEGFVVRQDAFGTPIKVVIPLGGSYFSLKSNCAYQFTLDATDLNPVNEIFRTDIGVLTLRSAIGTGQGIMFMNTANASKPQINILQRNALGDNFDVKILFPQFSFENYIFNDVLVDTWDDFILIGCKSSSDNQNDRLLLCNPKTKTVDISYYGIRASTKVNGVLYGGDPVTQTTWELFTGFDDNGVALTNFWDGAGETYGSDVLKKVKKLRFGGKIAPAQSISVYVSLDDADFQLIGTILGSGDYVDYSTTYAVGTTFIGQSNVGGGSTTNVYNFFLELKLRLPKFRKRKVRFIANGIGYASIQQITDFDIWAFQDKMPSRYRVKQNVSLDGTQTNL